jgi:hypothetical protein
MAIKGMKEDLAHYGAPLHRINYIKIIIEG